MFKRRANCPVKYLLFISQSSNTIFSRYFTGCIHSTAPLSQVEVYHSLARRKVFWVSVFVQPFY
jgi:hypothetical protein